MRSIRKLSALALCLTSFSVLATDTSWNFRTHGESAGSQGYVYGNSLSFSQSGLSVTVNAWADTNLSDRSLESAITAHNNGGLLNYNRHRGSVKTNPYKASNGYYYKKQYRLGRDGHAIDNIASKASCSKQYNDAKGSTNGNWRNSRYSCSDRNVDSTDFMLFSFSEAVSISELSVGWIGGRRGSSSFSVGAYDMSNSLSSTPNLIGKTWSSVVDDLMFKQSFHHTGGYGSRYGASSATVDLTAGGTAGTTGVSSKYWLVGAYNAAFGALRDSYSNFKLAGLTTHSSDGSSSPQSASVTEPGTLALFGLAGLFLWQRRRNELSKAPASTN